MDISSERSTILDIPPSAVAFCPSHPEYYVVGTYFLHPKDESSESSDGPQKRTGTLILFRLNGTEFTHVQTVALDSAVLDIEWTPHVSALGDLLCVATSTGSLEFYSFDTGSEKLQPKSKHQVSDPSTLVLDLLWHPIKADTIAVTLSDGAVSICQSTGDKTNPWSQDSKITDTEITTHSLEPWTLAFSPDASLVYSGGDDAILQAVRIAEDDSEAQSDTEASPTGLWTDRKTHQAGVTAILPLANDLLVTGSYDDHIRLISAPLVGRRQVLAELDLGGGVWRLKMLDDGAVSTTDSPSYTFFASCMHAGSRVVRLQRSADSGEWAFDVQARFEEHRSMNYGSDVQPFEAGREGRAGEERVVVSSSFYDKLMCTWRI